MSKLVVYSLWSGPLPSVAELHFRSTLHHMGDAEYHLFLDDTPGYEGVVTEEFSWLTRDPRVTITRVDLRDYFATHSIKMPALRRHLVPTAVVRRVLRQLFRLRLKFGVRQGHPALPYGVHDDPVFGITAGHAFRPWRQMEDLSYRADIFRVLAPEFFPDDDVVWLDLDMAVFQDLSWLKDRPPSVYRWGDLPFANNAFIYLPAAHPEARRALVDAMNSLGAARPWTLFSDEICQAAGIDVLDVADFDVQWISGHPLEGDYHAVFAPSAQARDIANDLASTMKMLHWHNNWRVEPISNSPFGELLARYRG